MRLIYILSLALLVLVACTSEKETIQKEEIPQMSKEEIAVRQVILDLFQGMYDADSAVVHQQFIDSARMYTTFIKNDTTQFHEGTLDKFLTAIGTPHDVKWIEKTWNYKIDVEGPLAQVWCNYAFYAGERFSHCGVDAFQLIKSLNGWKIIVITDTRSKSDCIFPTGEFFEPN